MRRAGGFTLIEMIVVIVLTGIVVGMVAVFLRTPVQAYVDSAARAELSDAADIAVRRIAREVRRALPNSTRVTGGGTTVEFIPTKSGGRYLAEEDNEGAGYLDFTDSTDRTFTVVGQMPSPAIVPEPTPLWSTTWDPASNARMLTRATISPWSPRWPAMT